MNLYEKIITSKYYYTSKTNWRDPIWSTIIQVSFFHMINVFSISIKLGADIKSLTKVNFMILSVVLIGILIWLHYEFLLKRGVFEKRRKLLDIKSIKVFDFVYLIYELITIGFLCYTLNIYWGNYFYICLVIVGIHFISKIFNSEKK